MGNNQKTVSFGLEYQEIINELEKNHPDLRFLNQSQKYIRVFERGAREMLKEMDSGERICFPDVLDDKHDFQSDLLNLSNPSHLSSIKL